MLDQRIQMNMFVVHDEKKLNPKKRRRRRKRRRKRVRHTVADENLGIRLFRKQVYEVIILTYLSLVSVAHFNERKNFTVIEPLQSANVNPTNLTSMAK